VNEQHSIHAERPYLRNLSLFTGCGGGELGFKLVTAWGGPRIRTVGYVEFNEYRQNVLIQRIKDGLLDDAPIFSDAREFDGTPWRGRVDAISGGFPCQPFSAAGKRKAGGDKRNMWPDTIRIIREVRPRICFLENVPGLRFKSHGYFGVVLKDLACSRYDVRWTILSAADVGAPHLRKRLWILAYANSE